MRRQRHPHPTGRARPGRRAAGTALAALAALASPPAPAQAPGHTWGLHLVSHHTEPGYNNRNTGIYWRHPQGWTAGAYCNSESQSPRFPQASRCQLSGYAGRLFDAQLIGPLRAGVIVGAITGYSRATVLPAAIATASLGPLRLWAAPRVSSSAGFVSLSIELTF